MYWVGCISSSSSTGCGQFKADEWNRRKHEWKNNERELPFRLLRSVPLGFAASLAPTTWKEREKQSWKERERLAKGRNIWVSYYYWLSNVLQKKRKSWIKKKKNKSSLRTPRLSVRAHAKGTCLEIQPTLWKQVFFCCHEACVYSFYSIFYGQTNEGDQTAGVFAAECVTSTLSAEISIR